MSLALAARRVLTRGPALTARSLASSSRFAHSGAAARATVQRLPASVGGCQSPASKATAPGASIKRSFASSALPATQKVAIVRATGDPSQLVVDTEFPVPATPDGGVVVKNEYAGVNFIDTYHRKGLYPREMPFVGGQEGSGFIASASDGALALGFNVGDRVAYSVFGTYAQYTAVPAIKLLPVPDEVCLDVAACCPVQALTAHYLTTDAHAGLIKPGEWMLIHGVGGGTCQWAAQMAKALGYKVIGTTSKSKLAVAETLGCDELIVLEDTPGTTFEDYTKVVGCDDVVSAVKDITGGEMCKAVIDGIGLATWELSLDSLAPRGIFVSFGNASGTVPAFPPLRLIGKSLYITRPKLLDYVQNRAELLRRSSDVFGWIADGQLKVSVDRAFPLDDAADSHAYLESGASVGKVLLKVPCK